MAGFVLAGLALLVRGIPVGSLGTFFPMRANMCHSLYLVSRREATAKRRGTLKLAHRSPALGPSGCSAPLRVTAGAASCQRKGYGFLCFASFLVFGLDELGVIVHNVCRKSNVFRLSAHKMRNHRSRNEPHQDELYRIAEQQGGYFTSAHAARAGFSHKLLWHYEKTGKLLRVARGIYRLSQFPSTRFEDLFVAWLRCGSKSVISHESALAVYDLSDVIPGEVHVTVPRTASRRRKGIRLHTNRLRPTGVVKREGLPVTSVPRTIADVARAGLSEDHVERAIRESLQRGLTTREALLAEAKRRRGRAARLIRAYVGPSKRPS